MTEADKFKLIQNTLRYSSRVAPCLSAEFAYRLFMHPKRHKRPQSEMKYYDSAEKFFLKDGTAVFVWGNKESPSVLLVHGWTGRGTQLGAFAEPLVAKGFRVIAIDGPAHGDSPGESTNALAFSQFLIKIQPELMKDEFAAVIAHSFGSGAVTLAVSSGLKTKKLVLVAGPSSYEKVCNRYAEYMNLSSKSQKYFFKFLTKRVGRHPRELQVSEIVKTLNVSALIVHDEDDEEVPFADAQEIVQNWPGAEFLRTKGLGHRRILRDPDVLVKVTNYIAGKKINVLMK